MSDSSDFQDSDTGSVCSEDESFEVDKLHRQDDVIFGSGEDDSNSEAESTILSSKSGKFSTNEISRTIHRDIQYTTNVVFFNPTNVFDRSSKRFS